MCVWCSGLAQGGTRVYLGSTLESCKLKSTTEGGKQWPCTQLSRVKYAMSWRVPRGKAMGA